MSKLKVSIVNQTTLKLEENGFVGDLIDLKEVQSVDQTFITRAIDDAKEETFKRRIKDINDKLEVEKNLELEKLTKKLKEEQQAIESEKNKLQYKLDSLQNEFNLNIKNNEIQLKSNFNIEKSKLENEINQLNKKIEEQRRIIQLELEQESSKKILFKDKEINELKLKMQEIQSLISQKELSKNAEIQKLEDKFKYLEAINKQEFENRIQQIKNDQLEKVNQLENEILNLKMAKSSLQVKMLGEELEKWCNNEFESYALSGFEDCKWFKDNKTVKDSPDEKATKGDYIFEVYLNSEKRLEDKILSVLCEMKNESPDSKTKTKNSDHYKKLDDDRRKKGSQYSLLISELEWDSQNDAPIKKIPEYENMYMVRPAYFISFLSLIKSLANKYKDLITDKRTNELNFKESNEILEEFEQFKNTYLDKPLDSLVKDVEKIKKQAHIAYESSYTVVSLADKIMSNTIAEMKIKIERFDIKKINRKIEKLTK